MLTLLSEAHFWTVSEDVNISDTDYGAFQYHEKKDFSESIYFGGKKSFAQKRGVQWNVDNKRPNKLKDGVKELEESLAHLRVVYCKWKCSYLLQIIFSSGLIANIIVDIFTGDIVKIIFDKYLIGKLLTDHLSDVVKTDTHIVCSYNDNQITFIYLTKQKSKYSPTEKLSRMEPKLQVLELSGPSGRRLERKLSCNSAGDMVLVWWRCMRDEVYPWSPLVKDQDRANVHIYGISGMKAELLCYYRTEFDPICVSFSQVEPGVIHTVEQRVSRKGDVTVDSCTCEVVGRRRLQRAAATSIPLQTQVRCLSFGPDGERLVLGCIDSSIVLFNSGLGVTSMVKAAFIPSLVSWHPDGTVVLISNEKGQFQCFDVALACIKLQLIGENINPSNLLDLGVYFRYQPTLILASWNPQVESKYRESYAQTDGILLLMFERGPLASLRVVGAGGEQSGCTKLRGTLQPDNYQRIMGGLSPEAVVTRYLSLDKTEAAVALLASLGWDSLGQACLGSLYLISNHLFRKRLNAEIEALLEAALGTFHAPLHPICHATELEFGDKVRAITRRFFHHLLRYQQFEKAFRLAIDLNDHDLFMDIFYYARLKKDSKLAAAARARADQITGGKRHVMKHNSDSDSVHCSRSSCSECSSGTESSQDSTSSDSEIDSTQGAGSEAKSESVNLGIEVMEKQVTFADMVPRIKGSPKPTLPGFSDSRRRLPDPHVPAKTRNMTTVSIPSQRLPPGHVIPEGSRGVDSIISRVLPTPSMPQEASRPVGRLDAVPDFSEEEDSGSIKVVHFGVV
ncbi:WD repeat-containing and planar cell polarity effector protein fritz homolog [Hetaerina americana]|uniref:WD repeat-containing and planar cell polarity effector protein fritz homolog n=1 Tax=Hetaerina americana TaxID=62018 RepID=UPI003A7F4EB9